MVDVVGVLGAVPAWAWVVVGIGLYWAMVLWLRETNRLPAYIGTQGPILTLHTKRFRNLLDRIGRPRRFWRAWGNLGVGIALVVMVGMFLFLLVSAIAQVQHPPPPSAVNQPQNFLVIPGVNQFLPLSVAPEIVLGLLLGLVVHEGGHGVLCRVGGIEVESVGLALLAVIPIGAFVEPNERSRQAADRGDQTRMFAAGVMNNFALTVIAFALLFGPVTGAIAVANGAAVSGAFSGSPAAKAGIGTGDRIVAIQGRPIANNSALGTTLAGIDQRAVTVSVAGPDGARKVTVERSLLVVGTTQGTPFETIAAGDQIVELNGSPLHTEYAFRQAVTTHRIVTLQTKNGTTVTGPVGAAVRFVPDGPAAQAGIQPGPAVITAIDGNRVISGGALTQLLGDTKPGQTISVEFYRNGTRTVHDVVLSQGPQGNGHLGVGVYAGYSGLTVNDFGVVLYPAKNYLQLLSGDVGGSLYLNLLLGGRGGFLAGVLGIQFLPFIRLLDPTMPVNFAGFTGGVANFYTVPGLPRNLVGATFGLANVLFWVGWINFNLGIFNCIPGYPLDGGHVLRTSTEAIVARLPVRDRRRLTRTITTSVGLVMLVSLFLMLFGPQLLS